MISGRLCRLRPHDVTECETLARIASDFAIARWMTARFPHPYTEAAAREWLAQAASETPTNHFAIEVDGALAGGVGFTLHDGERRGVAEFGYWLGRAYWGRGIATEAAQLLAAYAFAERHVRRLQAHVFAGNVGSVRVLEKSGFVREALMRAALVERDGTIADALFYARLAS